MLKYRLHVFAAAVLIATCSAESASPENPCAPVAPVRDDELEASNRATRHAVRGEWTEANAALDRMLELNPDDVGPKFQQIVISVRLELLYPYSCDCYHLLGQFRDTDDPCVAERVAHACLLAEADVKDGEAVYQLAARAVAAEPENRWMQLTRGMAEYRRGDFEQAIRWLSQVVPRQGAARLALAHSLLLTAFKHFLANEWEKARAQKRGGGRAPIPLDFASADSRLSIERADELTPDQLYDRQ